jgi:putative pyruvate formate lyase activating enzyme
MDSMRSRSLRRYYEILEGDAEARYLHAKEIRTGTGLEGSTEDLWRIHERTILRGGADSGEHSLLDLKIGLARKIYCDCTFCERRCHVNRASGEQGHCGVLDARICSEFVHMGEEPDIVPSYTIFFAGCTLDCVYCQNWDISTRPRAGVRIPPKELAEMIDAKGTQPNRGQKVRNVNWVGGDPTSNMVFILETLAQCKANLPQVWNSNMYLTEESMNLLDGVIDVYLTDFKYGNDKCALTLSNAPHYTTVVSRNHLLARRQAEMIIRHLVLPGHIECCTRPVLTWIADNLENVIVNVMAQYHPEHRARDAPGMTRGISSVEYDKAMRIADDLGLETT